MHRAIAITLAVALLGVADASHAGTITYVLGTDFGGSSSFTEGDVTAPVELVPNLGGDPGDFASFTPGRIAVIERGEFLFSHKIYNAQVYGGALGVIILRQPDDDPAQPLGMSFGGFPEDPPAVNLPMIPSVILSNDLSASLRAELLAGPISPIVFRIAVSETILPDETWVDESVLQRIAPATVPEPTTLSAWGLLGVVLGLARRYGGRRRRGIGRE